jgi:hypothetical protein
MVASTTSTDCCEEHQSNLPHLIPNIRKEGVAIRNDIPAGAGCRPASVSVMQVFPRIARERVLGAAIDLWHTSR